MAYIDELDDWILVGRDRMKATMQKLHNEDLVIIFFEHTQEALMSI